MDESFKQLGDNETKQAELVRLPLWRSCVEEMRKNGLAYGKTYDAAYFEERLRCARFEMRFGLAISEIRKALEVDGFYLSGRGLKGDSFIILEPARNVDVMANYSAAAMDALKRGVILGTNTRLDLLSAEERRKHESMLEKLAMRLLLSKRCQQVFDVVKKHKAALVEPAKHD